MTQELSIDAEAEIILETVEDAVITLETVEEAVIVSAKKNKKQYFTEETEQAIIQYNLLEDAYDRNRLYDSKIKKPFEKLVENMIHTFKFYHFDVPYEDVKHETIAFLNEKIHKYTDPSKGKAFSYFSIVAKNYLILHNNSNYDKFRSTDQPDVIDEQRNVMNEIVRESEKEDRTEFVDLYVGYLDENLSTFFKSLSDISVADSVLELFRRRENIENFNKKALYIMIRDRTGVKTQYITKVINSLKRAYKEMYINYVQTGRVFLDQNFFNKSEFVE
jgi:uncharacterized protein YerC